MTEPKYVMIQDIAGVEGQEVLIKGWIRHNRSSGKLSFLTVRDGSGDLQALVAKNNVGEEQFALCRQLTQESSVILQGKPKRDDRAPGGFELEYQMMRMPP